MCVCGGRMEKGEKREGLREILRLKSACDVCVRVLCAISMCVCGGVSVCVWLGHLTTFTITF